VTVAVRIDPVAVLDDFIDRCEAAVRRWQASYRSLHDALDGLQTEAAANGLVDSIGQDEVQQHMAEAFAKVRKTATKFGCRSSEVVEVDPLIAGSKICADTQHHLAEWESRKAQAAADDYEDTFAAAYHVADERERNKPGDPNTARLRELLDDDVTLERAQAELNRRDGAAISTVEALMLILRERGIAALQDPKTRERLAQLSELQVVEVGDRLQRLKTNIARAWSPEEVGALVSAWEEAHA
jgi:hypothetical protein